MPDDLRHLIDAADDVAHEPGCQTRPDPGGRPRQAAVRRPDRGRRATRGDQRGTITA